MPEPEFRRMNFNFEREAIRDNDIPIPIEDILNPMRRNTGGQVLDTIGIELESLALSRDYVARILAKLPYSLGGNYKVHRDGSAEINAYALPNGLMINSHTKAARDLFEGKYVKSTIGYELISNPMDIETAELSLRALLPALKANGDFISERCATHIHVGGMKNLGFLKRELKLALWFDEVFFALAHMDGERFRGYSNNAIYARPLINGPYFRVDRTYYQTLNWEKALEATDLFEFFACYGLELDRGELPKYHPGRYFSLNLYSVPRIGTVEFRYFNQTFNPDMVVAVAKLCQMFVEIGIKSRMTDLSKLTPGNPFTLRSPSYYISKLHKFLELSDSLDSEYHLTQEDISILEHVMLNYKGIGIEDKEVSTHCRDFEISSSVIKLGELRKATKKPCPDGHTDIHNIENSSILGG